MKKLKRIYAWIGFVVFWVVVLSLTAFLILAIINGLRVML